MVSGFTLFLPAALVASQGDTEWADFLARSDPVNVFSTVDPYSIPDVWLEAPFLGNGMLGVQVMVCPGGLCRQSLLMGTSRTPPNLTAPHLVRQ